MKAVILWLDIDTFTLVLIIILFDRPEILSNQSFVYESRRSLARHEYIQGGQQQCFIFVFFSIRYQTLISDMYIDKFLLALFIVSLDLKSVVIKVLFMKAIVL